MTLFVQPLCIQVSLVEAICFFQEYVQLNRIRYDTVLSHTPLGQHALSQLLWNYRKCVKMD